MNFLNPVYFFYFWNCNCLCSHISIFKTYILLDFFHIVIRIITIDLTSQMKEEIY